jgi:DNA-binding SARP family transcriptional activator/Tfp pilus assembly protein PilF
MEFCLLGPLVVRRGGVVVPVPRGKQRAVLAALLLNAGRVVSVDDLAETLWGANPPVSARVSVQNHVKRLRQVLGDVGHAVIGTQQGGYVINEDVGRLDVSRFETLTSAAQAAARRGLWDIAAQQARAALALWRGEPLTGVESELLALREVSRLAEMRLQTEMTRIEADLQLGGHASVIGELQRLAAAHPLRERLHAMLMLACYRDGRRGEALAVYQRARRILIDEVGTEPGAELRKMHAGILTADAALAAPDSAPDPVPGPELAVPHQLPAAVRHFCGREGELTALTGLLDEAGPAGGAGAVVIGGTAGVGKTALALHWAHQNAGRFPNGQLYVNLRGFDPSGAPMMPAQVLREFLSALGVQPNQIPVDTGAQAGLYRSMLAGRRMLILLDNARDADQVRPLLPGNPACMVIVTSRRPLTGLVAAEGAHLISLDVLTRREARDLLARHLGTSRLVADSPAVDELIRLCAQLPLALTIAAARAAAHPRFPLAALTADLRGTHGQLDTLDTGDATTSVRVVFSWSQRSLTVPGARMFRLLGLHPGPDVSATAAASLAGMASAQARGALAELVTTSLIAEQAPGRFAFHDLLRAYAAELAGGMEHEQERQDAIRRVLDYYLHTAHAAVVMLYPTRGELALCPPHAGAQPDSFPGYRQAWAWLDAEYPVLIGVIAVAFDAGFDAHAWQLPWMLAEFQDRRGRRQDWAACQRTALAAATRLADPQAQGRAHRDLGYAYARLGAFCDADTHLRHAFDLYRRLGDHAGLARAHYARARLFEFQDDQERALGEAQRALRSYQTAGHLGGQARMLNAVGWYLAQQGHYERAVSHCQQAITLLRDLGDRAGEADAWDSLGFAHHHLGHHTEAVACYTRAMDPYRDLGDRGSQAAALTRIGDTYDAAGNHSAARGAWRQALTIFNELRDPAADQLRSRLGQQPVGPAPAIAQTG